MNNQTAYWIWIQQAIGYASEKLLNILENFTFAEDFYRASLEDKFVCGCFTKSDISKLKDTSLEKTRQIINRCNECGIEIVTVGDVAYPERLRCISAPPAVLYVKGNKEVLSDEFSVAMVGTRTATPYGMRNAFDFGFQLAKGGVTVISGGARGIDTYSHRGTLQADGKTVCVLGCGIEYKYLRENDEMKRQIMRKGAVISEYPPDMNASKYTFPKRNRIISGLSKGVLVIEAGSKSGSLITANLALEQNRDVFAVPGDISSDVSFGTNQLIKDGAIPVTSAADIFDYYSGKDKKKKRSARRAKPAESRNAEQVDIVFDAVKPAGTKPKRTTAGYTGTASYDKKPGNEKPKKTVNRNKRTFESGKYEVEVGDIVTLPKISEEDFNELSANAKKVLSVFNSEQMHIDMIVEKSGLSVNDVHSAITLLEMYDFVESMKGRNYKILVSIK